MGILTRTLSDGTKRYDVRLWYRGKSYFRGGFTTRDAAKRAMREVMGEVDAARAGVPEVRAPYDPTIRALLGNPDADAAGEGTYLEWLALPNNKAPNYVRRVRTAVRALLPFFGDRRVSELTADIVREYQRTRQASPRQVGAKARAAALARRRERFDARAADDDRRKALGLPARRGRRPEPVPEGPAADGACTEGTRTVGPACVNREILALRAALTWAADPERDPARRLDRSPLNARRLALQEPEPPNPSLSVQDEVALLNACRPPWLRELVSLLLGTGMRPGEALALRWSDVNPDQRLATVRHSKTNRSRQVPIPARVLAMLESRRPKTGDGLVFLSRSDKPIGSGKAAHHFTPIARSVGLTFTLHGCRHIWASRALSAGASLPQIASVLGHATLQVARRYSHSRLPDLQALVDEVAERARPRPALVETAG